MGPWVIVLAVGWLGISFFVRARRRDETRSERYRGQMAWLALVASILAMLWLVLAVAAVIRAVT